MFKWRGSHFEQNSYAAFDVVEYYRSGSMDLYVAMNPVAAGGPIPGDGQYWRRLTTPV